MADDGLCAAISAPGAAPWASLCNGDRQQSRGDGRVGDRCAQRSHDGGGGAAQTFLPVLFLQLQLHHCTLALCLGDGGEARNHVHFALDTPENHKNRTFFEKTS